MAADVSVADTEPDRAPTESRAPARSTAARIWSVIGVVALIASAGVGGNVFGARDRLFGDNRPPRPAAAGRDAAVAASRPEEATRLRSQPWWQRVSVLHGSGPQDGLSVDIGAGALQWRVRPTCSDGRLEVEARGRRRPLVSTECPVGAETLGYATVTGTVRLAVRASGPWELLVEQQVDVPLVESPTPAMQDPATRPVARATFYRMDQTGTGSAIIYRLVDGRHALRLEDIFITPNVDLEITLSPLPGPRTTEEFTSAPWVFVSRLDITAGSLNFEIPPEVDPLQFRSIVIWCEQLHSAYAGAALEPLR